MIDPIMFFLYIGNDGRSFFESTCRTLAQYVAHENHDAAAYEIYEEIVRQILDIILEIPGGADWWSYVEKLKLLPNIDRLIGREFIRLNPAIQNILRKNTTEFGISLYFHMRDQEFLKLPGLYSVNFEYQMNKELSLQQLILVKFGD